MKTMFVFLLVLLSALALGGCAQTAQDVLLTTGADMTQPDDSNASEANEPETMDSSELMDYAAFANLFMDSITARYDVEYTFELLDDSSITASLNGEHILDISLENTYREYLLNGDAEHAVNQFIMGTLEMLMHRDAGIDISTIMPVIRSEEFVAHVRDAGTDLVNEPLLDDELYILFVVDFAATVRFLDIDSFEGLGVSREDLLDLSIANLTNMLPAAEVTFIEGLYIVSVDDYYETSLLLTGFLDEIDIPISGEMVIGIPGRNVLVIADSENQDATDILAGFTQEYHQVTGYPISGRLLMYSNGTFSWFE